MRTPNVRVRIPAIVAFVVLLLTASCNRSSTSPTPIGLSVTGLSPSVGPVGPGTSVVITGSGFQSGVTVTFDAIPATVASVSGSALTVVAPAHAVGRVDVVVTNPGGASGRLPGAYTYSGLFVASFSPTAGFAGIDVRFVGTGFTSSTIVAVGGVPAQIISVTGATITVRIPDRATDGRVDVVFTNPGADDVTLRDAFTYQVASITVNPMSVAPLGQFSVKWSVSAGRSTFDWIGLFRAGDANEDYFLYAYTNGAVSGTVGFPAPSQPGQYQFRYLLDDGYIDVARSPVVTVAPALSAFERWHLTRNEHESTRCSSPSKESFRSGLCPSIDLPLVLSRY